MFLTSYEVSFVIPTTVAKLNILVNDLFTALYVAISNARSNSDTACMLSSVCGIISRYLDDASSSSTLRTESDEIILPTRSLGMLGVCVTIKLWIWSSSRSQNLPR